MKIGQYLNLIPDNNLRDSAIKNAKKAHPERLEQEVESFTEALGGAFDWSGSPEGHRVWNDLHNYAKMHGI